MKQKSGIKKDKEEKMSILKAYKSVGNQDHSMV